jgi:hypothetical protein
MRQQAERKQQKRKMANLKRFAILRYYYEKDKNTI